MSAISTHVLDTARGRPAAGVSVALERAGADGIWQAVGQGTTDASGRIATLMPESRSVAPGLYRLIFHTRPYFENQEVRSFFPYATVTFDVAAGEAHYHVPLLVSPFGYTTYRGT